MPLNERVFNRAVTADNAAELLNRFEKLRRELRSRANRQQLIRAYNGESANFGLRLGGMEKLQDLKALGELLGIENPFETEDPTRRRDIILSLQSNEEIRARIAEVGAPTQTAQIVSDFIADSVRDAEGQFQGGFTTPGVARSLSLFMREYMAENGLLTAQEVSDDPGFGVAASNYVTMIEYRERIAENNRILDLAAEGDLTELENVMAIRGDASLGDTGQFLQQEIEALQGDVNRIIGANPGSLVNRVYETSINNEWLSQKVVEVNDATFSLIPDDEWQLFISDENFTPAVRDHLNANRAWVEENFASRPDKGTSFLVWSGGEFSQELTSVVDRFGPVSFGFHMDTTLDPLINEVVGELPVEIRQAARDRMKEFIATIQIGPNQDKGKLWVEFSQGLHGQTPDGVLDRYIGDIISARTGGAEFVESARAAGISLASLAGESGDPQEWLESITTNGAARGLPLVQVVPAEQINQRAWVIEQFAGDPDIENAPAVVRNAIYSATQAQLNELGLDPLTTANQADYSFALGRIGVTPIKSNTLEAIVRASSADGAQLWEELKRRQAATGHFAPDSIMSIFNELPVDKDTLLIDNLNVQLEEQAQSLGPSPEEAQIAAFAEKTRNLPTALQGVANRRIDAFLATFVGEERAAVLEREDVQDRIALIIEGVGQEFIGSDEVVELAVSSFGGLNEFFGAFPELQESDIDTIGEFIVDNFDTIVESAGEDAEVAELTRARQRVLTERRTEELRQRRQVLQNEAEERALEFDESEQGRELQRLQQEEGIRQEQLQVFQPELERVVRQRIAGPAASQVLADVGPQLQREFLARQEGLRLGGTDRTLSPADFLGGLDDDFFQQQRRLSNIRRSPVNIAAPQQVGLGREQNTGPGFSPFRRGL